MNSTLHRGLSLLIPTVFLVVLPQHTHGHTGPGAAAAGVSNELPASDSSGIRAAHEAARHAVMPGDAGGHSAWNPGQRWTTRFDGRGFETVPDDGEWIWGLDLVRWGREGHERTIVGNACAEADGQRLAYAWDGALTEWWVNDGRGLEHGYTVQARPEGDGALVFSLAVRGALCAEANEGRTGVRFSDASGATVLTYAGLRVWDADGQPLPARMGANGNALQLVVDDCGARYPLTVDPMAQQAYLKASNAEAMDFFGYVVAVSGDTVVVGAYFEDSAATGVNGNQFNNGAPDSGAAYVFVRDGTTWSQQAYLKASNTGAGDSFGRSVAVCGDTVVVGAHFEDSAATGVDGDQSNNDASFAGAAYVFVRDGTTWTQQAYLKASNTEAGDLFGSPSICGDTIVVTAGHEGSAATGVNGDQSNNDAPESGAAYVFVRDGTTWSQQAYLKASNTEAEDRFGRASVSGDTIVVAAAWEDSAAKGVDGDQSNNDANRSGAAYVFVRNGTTWTQQAYLKASNTEADDQFSGVSVSGDTIVVGAPFEDSAAKGINGDQSSNSCAGSGAAYVFVRNGTTWTQQAYLKASNTDLNDSFGVHSISGDTIVAGAPYEDSAATGVNGDQLNNDALDSGAAYVFVRNGTTWSQLAYLKASNTESADFFGESAVSGDTVVVGAWWEDSAAHSVNGDQSNNSASTSGAAYIFDLDLGVPGDLDGDGAVNGTDLGILLGTWGTDGSGDLNGDGVVDGADLGELLANWTG